MQEEHRKIRDVLNVSHDALSSGVLALDEVCKLARVVHSFMPINTLPVFAQNYRKQKEAVVECEQVVSVLFLYDCTSPVTVV